MVPIIGNILFALSAIKKTNKQTKKKEKRQICLALTRPCRLTGCLTPGTFVQSRRFAHRTCSGRENESRIGRSKLAIFPDKMLPVHTVLMPTQYGTIAPGLGNSQTLIPGKISLHS